MLKHHLMHSAEPAVERSGLQGLQDDQPVEFELYHDERRNKTSAVDLKLI